MTNLAIQNGSATTFSLPVPVEAMRSLLSERKNLIVKIGDAYEISRPLALELYRLLTEEVIKAGGSIRESQQVQYASPEMVIVSVSVAIQIGNQEVVLTEIGEAYSKEKGKDTTLARTAFTRAWKRVLERIAGEDFINRFILQAFPRGTVVAPASQKQVEFIRKLLTDGRLTQEKIASLKESGLLTEDFDLEKALEEGLSSDVAKLLIDTALGKRR
ncbi:MAG: hypothetical protein QW733_02835 [Desulfurococcaceae archaeon]